MIKNDYVDWKGLNYKCVICGQVIQNPNGFQFICGKRECKLEYNLYKKYLRLSGKTMKEVCDHGIRRK